MSSLNFSINKSRRGEPGFPRLHPCYVTDHRGGGSNDDDDKGSGSSNDGDNDGGDGDDVASGVSSCDDNDGDDEGRGGSNNSYNDSHDGSGNDDEGGAVVIVGVG